MNRERSKFDVPHKDECPDCEGVGYTQGTGTVMRESSDGKLTTLLQGSGCPSCCGVGRLEPK